MAETESVVNVEIMSTKNVEISYSHDIRKYIGKKVFTKDGEEIGYVKRLLFRDFECYGILVSKRFGRKKHFFAREYIDKLTNHSVILSIVPITLLKGKTVFDSAGRIAGKVTRITRLKNSNEIDSLYFKKGIFRREQFVKGPDVTLMKKNIKLKVEIRG